MRKICEPVTCRAAMKAGFCASATFPIITAVLAALFLAAAATGFAEDKPNFSVGGETSAVFEIAGMNEDSPLYLPSGDLPSLSSMLTLNPVLTMPDSKFAQGVLDLDLVLIERFIHSTGALEQELLTSVNEAYLKVRLSDWLFLAAGKRRVVWGAAWFLNPTDFINPPKNPLDPREEKRGVYSFAMDLLFPELSVNQVVVLFDTLDALGTGTKLATSELIPQTDLAGVFYYSAGHGFNFGFSLDSTPLAEAQVSELSDIGIQAEIAFYQKSERYRMAGSTVLELKPDKGSFYIEALCGLRYTLPLINTVLIAEYVWQEDGNTQDELEAFASAQTDVSAAIFPGVMARHTLYLTITQPNLTRKLWHFTDTLGLSAYCSINLEDASALFVGAAESSVIENVSIVLRAGYYHGAMGTEYGLSPSRWFVSFMLKAGV